MRGKFLLLLRLRKETGGLKMGRKLEVECGLKPLLFCLLSFPSNIYFGAWGIKHCSFFLLTPSFLLPTENGLGEKA